MSTSIDKRAIKAARALRAKFYSPSTVAFQKANKASSERSIAFWRTVGFALREPELYGQGTRAAIYNA